MKTTLFKIIEEKERKKERECVILRDDEAGLLGAIEKYGLDLQGLEGKNIRLYFPSDGYESSEVAYYHMEHGQFKHDFNDSMKETVSINPATFYKLQEMMCKGQSLANYLEGKNINLYFTSNGYDGPETYYHHIDKGIIKKGRFPDAKSNLEKNVNLRV